MLLLTQLTRQIDELASIYDQLRADSPYDDLSGGTSPDHAPKVKRLGLRAVAAAERLLPPGTSYRRRADAIVSTYSSRTVINSGGLAIELLEILRAFRDDLEAGFLSTLTAAIRGDVFVDFLEMAEQTLNEIHRTPAAVVAGFTLEEHLRKLCLAHGIATMDDEGRARKADSLNADLTKAGAFDKTEAKEVTAWLGRRNDAAHGHHDRYTDDQVALMIEAVRGFIARHPV